MDEFELIERYFAGATPARPDVRVGIGDDGAVVTVPGARSDLVLVTDTIVAGVHFPARAPAPTVGHRALAVNLSDLAAMGAEPAWALTAITLAGVDEAWVEAFQGGFAELAAAHGVALVGGDTTAGPALTITVTAAGLVPTGTALCRNGARPGDLLAVTGSPGDAAAGLDIVQQARGGEIGDARAAWLVHRFLHPTPRVAAGLHLRGEATAAIDISDGLLADADKLARASGVVVEIDAACLPCSPALIDRVGRVKAETLALTGGDDYELLCTLPPQSAAHLGWLAEQCAAPLTLLGRVRAAGGADAAPGAVALRGGERLPLDAGGYRHLG